MNHRPGCYDPELLATFTGLRGATSDAVREIQARHLVLGMVLARDVFSKGGVLLVARGFEVTPGLVERFRNQAPGTIQEPICVTITEPTAAQLAKA
jgi:hypothetical protein